MFEQDYIMRLIQQIVKALLKLIFNIDTDKKEVSIFTEKESETKYDELINLIDKGEINEAENKLLAELNPEDMQYCKIGLMFYSYLNEKDIDFLEEHNFSKNGIIEGLKHVSEVYGYGSIANALFSTLSD